MMSADKLKVFVALAGWTFLVLVVIGKLNILNIPGSKKLDHSTICSVRANQSREGSLDTVCNWLSAAKQVEKISESTEAATTQTPKEYVHFRDIFNKTYSTQILTGPDNVQDNTRYFIYRCDTVTMTNCGGWTDRVKGILAAYIIANLTGRVFKAEMIIPNCDIKNFIVPNHVNWSLPVSIHEVIHASKVVQIMTKINNMEFYYRINTTNFLTLPAMKAKYIYYKSNLDYMEGFQQSRVHQKQLSWMQNLTSDQIAAEVYKRLFKLNPRFQSKVEAFLSKNVRPSDKLICAHVRTGRNPTIPNDTEVRLHAKNFYKVWDFLQKISKGNNSKIFIMTDSEGFKMKTKQQSFQEKLIFSEGDIVHLELSRATNKKCAGLEKVIFDQFILMHCDTLLVSRSFLGFMAAYVRGSDQDLYCILHGGHIVPCKRSKLKELFYLLKSPPLGRS